MASGALEGRTGRELRAEDLLVPVIDAPPTVSAANDVPGDPMVTDEKPSLPAATTGTMSALINASIACVVEVARGGVGRSAEAQVGHLDVEPAGLARYRTSAAGRSPLPWPRSRATSARRRRPQERP